LLLPTFLPNSAHCSQIVAAKAVPLTDVITEDHLKPFVKEHAQDIEQGVQQLTEGQLIPGAEQVQEQLPELAEQFTEEKLKPAAERLAKEIEAQVNFTSSSFLPPPPC